MFSIGILLFDNFEELDAIGPWEVFRVAEEMSGGKIICEMVALGGEKVTAKKGLKIDVGKTLTKDSRYDLILLPGGEGSRALMADGHVLDLLTQVADKASWVTSVCSGSLVYAKAGLLAGRKCTSHHSCLDFLAELSPTSEVVKNHRFVQDGNIVTSAGVSAGIDMALWLVGQIMTPEFAREVQHYLEYYPDPPYAP
ncbi:MAG: thiamine biosynthesis protein ThiJ [Alphaproteobacteria bacterium]|nr:MAG: thiamine biosynthesis protein ThiJ [Alphaproteobacteria bacterium]